jgi:dTDP-glucose 4,6-dehydratase
VIDSSKAKQELGWKTEVSFDEGLAGVVRWVDDNWDEIKRESLEYIHKP